MRETGEREVVNGENPGTDVYVVSAGMASR